MATKKKAKNPPHSITVLLKEEEYARFHAFCEESGHKKSTFIARLIRGHLDEQRFQMQGALVFAPQAGS